MKNIQEQIGHLQHIIQLLPLINRDTLYVLLQFLGLVAENAEDKLDETGKGVGKKEEDIFAHSFYNRYASTNR